MEDTFRSFSGAASLTEADRQDRAERMVREAVNEYEPLKKLSPRVFVQGSYRNKTNVRQDSDVDVCVCCDEPFYYDFVAADYGIADANVVPATPVTYPAFKNYLEAALVKKFGKAGVTRGNKAFDVHANTARVDADVVAAFAFRKYKPKKYSPLLSGYMTGYVEPVGTRFCTDNGLEVTNWPEQHYTKGVSKNDITNRRFKAIVRAIKSLKYEMEAKGIAEAKPIGSYMMECMVYNVSDALFGGYAYAQNVKDCIAVVGGQLERPKSAEI